MILRKSLTRLAVRAASVRAVFLAAGIALSISALASTTLGRVPGASGASGIVPHELIAQSWPAPNLPPTPTSAPTKTPVVTDTPTPTDRPDLRPIFLPFAPQTVGQTAILSAEMRPQWYFPYAVNLYVQKDPIVRRSLAPLGGCSREIVTTPAGSLYLNDVAVDGRGTTWIATDRGAVGQQSDGTWITLLKRDGLAYDHVTSVAIAMDGSPWFGMYYRHRYPASEGGGVYQAGGITGYSYPGMETWRNTGAAGTGGFGSVEDLAVDARNNKWVVTGAWILDGYVDWGGVYRQGADRRWEHFAHAAGVDLANAERAVADAEGNVWFDTWDGIVLRTAAGHWTRHLGPGGPDAAMVGPVVTDATRREVWLAGDRAFYMRDATDTWHRIPAESEQEGRGAHTLGADARGNLWWASEGAAGVVWADGRREPFAESDLFGDRYIDWIEVDATGAVWFSVSPTELVRLECP